ncbi:hypothetical protein QQ045_030299 [Rhodiola kirilowii]
MNQRRTTSQFFKRGHRREHMEKWITAGKYINKFWFVVLTSFICWLLLVIYLYDYNSKESSSNILQIVDGVTGLKTIQPGHNLTLNVGPSINQTDDDMLLVPKNNTSYDIDHAESIKEVVNSKNGTTEYYHIPIVKSEEDVPAAKEADDDDEPDMDKRNEVVVPEAKQAVDDDRNATCAGRYIFVHRIPRHFNEDLLRDCKTLSKWTDMCMFLSNKGLGPQLANTERVFSNTGWYATNQFSLEVIFHNRMRQYDCLTEDSSLASAIFVPFYPGLDVSRYLWCCDAATKDAAPKDLVKLLTRRPEWRRMRGRDHFLVAGRICWDFRRPANSDWGSTLMLLPETKNMTTLTIESSPWNNSDIAIPYPTYFHPSSDKEVFDWQYRMRKVPRTYLFSFAGAPRPDRPGSVRDQIIEQCKNAKTCFLLECGIGRSDCHNPSRLMKMFQSSIFCLQPPGDSFTRRSTFDSILAGCIPVFFHPGSAYVQYMWHLPKNFNKYSVFIPMDQVKAGNMSIEEELTKIPAKRVTMMREEVIKLIPKVIYADPRSRLETLEDAFDITVKSILNRIEKMRERMRDGKDAMDGEPDEEVTWKYNLFGTTGNHDWDHFFSGQM